MKTLEKELATFEEHRAQWVETGHEGQWVVIRGDVVLGFYSTFEEAFAVIQRDAPGENILVKEVRPNDPVETIQRVFWGTRC